MSIQGVVYLDDRSKRLFLRFVRTILRAEVHCMFFLAFFVGRIWKLKKFLGIYDKRFTCFSVCLPYACSHCTEDTSGINTWSDLRKDYYHSYLGELNPFSGFRPAAIVSDVRLYLPNSHFKQKLGLWPGTGNTDKDLNWGERFLFQKQAQGKKTRRR